MNGNGSEAPGPKHRLRCPSCSVLIELRGSGGGDPGQRIRLDCPQCGQSIQARLPGKVQHG